MSDEHGEVDDVTWADIAAGRCREDDIALSRDEAAALAELLEAAQAWKGITGEHVDAPNVRARLWAAVNDCEALGLIGRQNAAERDA